MRQQIRDRLNVAAGRIVPTESDLSISTGRRISAAVLFLDICQFSSRRSESEDEQKLLLAILNLFFSELVKIAEDYSGTVEKNTGDGLMAYFDDSSTDSNGSHRAVACALTMFAAAENLLNPLLVQSGIPRIDFRICIDHGNITIAKMGAARRFSSIVAIGTTANIASKMLSVASANQLLLGANAKKALPQLWQTEWTTLHTYHTGWEYTLTKTPYPFYLYTGRWARLT